MHKAVMNAIEIARNDTDLAQLASALGVGTPAEIEGAIAWATFEEALSESMTGQITDLYGQSGELGAAVFEGSFDLTNPRAVEWIDSHVGDLITVISDESKLAIRQIVKDGFLEGHTVKEMAREIRSYIGLTQPGADSLAKYARELEAEAGEGAGLNAARLEKARAYADELIRGRADMIARTETITASAAGQRESWEQAAEEGLIDPATTQRVWIASDDACDICDDLDGTAVAFDEEFPEGDPAVHPNCRCTTALVFE